MIVRTLAMAAVLSLASYSAWGAEDDCLGKLDKPLLVEVCDLLDQSMADFNSGDMRSWTRTMNFPHARLSGSTLQVWNTAEDYLASMDGAALRSTGWSYTKFESRRIVQASNDKVHIAAHLARYDSDDQKITDFDTFFVVTRVSGHLGVQLRSSFTGIVSKNTPY